MGLTLVSTAHILQTDNLSV